ncbi:MAG: AMP-binding protein [Pikeienuella sp.]
MSQSPSDQPKATPPASGRVILGDRAVAFESIHSDARRIASGLADAGMSAGSTLAIMLRNDEAFFTATVAAALIDATATPINWHFTADEVAYLLTDCEARAWIVHADLWRRVGADIPQDVLAGLLVLVVETPDEIAAAFNIAAKDQTVPADAINLAAWQARFPEWDGPPPQPRNAMIYTSGTTGRPKGVKRIGVVGVTRRGNYNAFVKGARTLLVAPMYHSAPNRCAVSSFFMGGDIILQPRFDAEAMLALIERHRITHMFVVPTMLVRLQKLPADVRARYDVSSLEHVVHAGAPCPADVKRAIIEWWGPVVYEYYGGTETGAVTYCTSAETLRKPGTVGCAVPDATIRIFDEKGQECPPGVSGEVYMRLHTLPDFTYQGLPEERRKVEHEGLITCGDVGHLDEDGYLFLTDRKKDMVISGGVNIYPAQVEVAMLRHPAILDCAVFGLPDADMGEKVVAAVQVAPGAALTLADLRASLEGQIATYMIPRDLFVLDALPRDPSGKMFKRKLRDHFA